MFYSKFLVRVLQFEVLPRRPFGSGWRHKHHQVVGTVRAEKWLMNLGASRLLIRIYDTLPSKKNECPLKKGPFLKWHCNLPTMYFQGIFLSFQGVVLLNMQWLIVVKETGEHYIGDLTKIHNLEKCWRDLIGEVWKVSLRWQNWSE